MTDIDRLMISLSEEDIQSSSNGEGETLPAARTKPAGFIVITFVVFLSWLPIFFLAIIRLI